MPTWDLRLLSPLLLAGGIAVQTCSIAAVSVSTLAQGFNGSGDVAVDGDGNIFVGNFGDFLSNANGTEVVRVTPEGQVSIFAVGFFGASGNSFDDDGNLYQSSIGVGTVIRLDPQGFFCFFCFCLFVEQGREQA